MLLSPCPLSFSMASSSTMPRQWLSSVQMASASPFSSPLIQTVLLLSLHFSSVSDSRSKIVQYGSNARFMTPLLLRCHRPFERILGLPTTVPQCGNFARVNTWCTDFLDSSVNVSTLFRTPPHSSASTFNTPPLVKVKTEPGIHSVIHLSDSSDGDEPPVSTPIPKPSPSSLRSTFPYPACRVSPSSIPCQFPHFHCSMSS